MVTLTESVFIPHTFPHQGSALRAYRAYRAAINVDTVGR